MPEYSGGLNVGHGTRDIHSRFHGTVKLLCVKPWCRPIGLYNRCDDRTRFGNRLISNGNIDGNIGGDIARDITGDITGDIARFIASDIAGDIASDIVGYNARDITRDITGAYIYPKSQIDLT